MSDNELHFFKVKGKCFAYAVNSTLCAEIDDVALSVLPELLTNTDAEVEKKYAHAFPKNKLHTTLEQCRQFLDEGVLPFRSKTYPIKIRSAVNTVSLHISHDCNLRCEYCYAKGGAFGGRRALMDKKMMVNAVDFIFSNSGNEDDIMIGFFGGEPLLNFKVLKECVRYSKKTATDLNKRVSFGVVTNATLLTPSIMKFLHQEKFSIIFSLDGAKKTHDRLRHPITGKGTHSLILRNILTYKQNYSPTFTVRGTFTRITPNFSEQVIFLNDQGFNEVSVEEAQLGSMHPYSIATPEQLFRVKVEYDRLAEIYIARFDEGRPLTFFHFENCLRELIRVSATPRACGVGGNAIAIAPDGRVYPCFESVVEEENCIGHVESGFDSVKRLKYQSQSIDNNRICEACWIKYFCGGGCSAFNIRYNKDISIPYEPNCELSKYRYMISAWILSEIIQRGEKAVERLKVHLGLE